MARPDQQGALYTDLIVEALTRYGDRPAFVCGSEVTTYAQAAATTSQLMQVLAARGVARGSGVAALGPNSPEMWLVQAATYLLGGRFTGLNLLGSAEEHARTATDAETSVLLVDAAHAATGARIRQLAPGVGSLLTVGAADTGEDVRPLCASVEPRPLEPGPARADDVAWLQYTGGTTGKPKGVMTSQRAMAQQVQTWLCSYGLPERPRYLAAAPITHAAVLALLPTLVRGGTVVLQQSFRPDLFLAAIEQYRINYAFAVPTMLYALCDSGPLHRYDLSSLQTLAYGAAPTSPSRLAELVGALGPVLLQGYAQTEAGGFLMTLRHDEHDPARRPELLTSCGRPAVGVVAVILDDHDQPVPDGQVGEICVRSAGVMTGYWRQPELTAQALSGGWLHTGDLGRRDAAGFFHIVDRKKDMVISGGFNVYPREVEDVLTSHPDVAAAAVIGVPHDKWGEQVTAYVVPRPGRRLEPDELATLVRERKGGHYAPRAVHLVDRLPVTAAGKPDKKALRARHWDAAGRQVN